MELPAKLAILADAAKYDASCASSGAPKRQPRRQGHRVDRGGMGICHSYTPDGRCVSLLKILLTNYCIYDCQYCVNRVSSDVPRARFSVAEVVRADARLLPAQLHRGAVPQLGHHPQRRLHDGAAGAASRADAARGPRLPRLHPPEDDPGGGAGADRRGRALRRPAERSTSSCRRRRSPRARWRRRRRARRSSGRWAAFARASTIARRKAGAQERRRAALRPGRPEHADDRRRGRGAATRDDPGSAATRCTAPMACGASTTRPSARSRTRRRALPLARAAAGARASALPGRLADAFLRLRAPTRCHGADAEPRSGDRSEAGVGADASRRLSRRRQPRRARAAAAGAGLGVRTVDRCCDAAGTGA